jgi:hypothetical protein
LHAGIWRNEVYVVMQQAELEIVDVSRDYSADRLVHVSLTELLKSAIYHRLQRKRKPSNMIPDIFANDFYRKDAFKKYCFAAIS